MSIELMDREHEAIMQTYKRLPIVIDRAEGCYIYDCDGNKYLDFLGGIAVNALGHSHPLILEAVQNQIEKYMHVSNYFYQKPQITLAEKLKETTGMDKVFFTNSGTEATEAAIKLSRKWGTQNGKKNMIAFSGGFHGRSYGALSLMDKPVYKDGMGPFLDNMKVIDYNDIDQLRHNVNEETLALMLEFIQGEGGISQVKPEFVKTIEELRAKYGFLVIADEIQSGIGRTGKFFAYEHYGIMPDIITSAKGLGGGLPLGAIIVNEKLRDVWAKGNHGTTYGGNAVACATGYVVVDLLSKGLMQNVVLVGDYLEEKLFALKEKYETIILEVRGKGLFRGLALSMDASLILGKLIDKKVIANATSGTVLRIVPPLIAGNTEVNHFVSVLDEVLAGISY
jgi:predicted acetylornithine/succinylornithine family transaminase